MLAESWAALPWSIRILRAFLGVTFVYAGAQKLLDPNFFRGGDPGSIGAQLHDFARGAPVGPLLDLLAKAPTLTGLGIALVEIAVGLGTLLGVGMLAAAVVGLSINVTLWLSATWHVHPYFLGSDSIYAVAWIVLVAGLLETERRSVPGRVASPLERLDGVGRREFVRGGLVGALTLIVAGAAKSLAGAPAKGLAALGSRSPSHASGGSPAVGPPAPSSQANPPQTGTLITTLSKLPVGKAIGFTAAGTPAVLLRLADNSVVAYSRICTHAGCSVGYDPSSQILFCPCHGAEFDPARHAQPISGPAPTPLQPIRVVVDKSGQIFLPS